MKTPRDSELERQLKALSQVGAPFSAGVTSNQRNSGESCRKVKGVQKWGRRREPKRKG